MTQSIVYKLMSTDLKINKSGILLWMLAAIIGFVITLIFPGLVAANVGFTLILSAIIGCGIQLMTNTILYDHLKGTQMFIMSLPVNYRQYILAKLLINNAVFYLMWTLLSVACLYITFSRDILPLGSLPMLVIVLLAILPAYTLILSVCIKSQSIAYITITTIIASIGTSAYLWFIVDLESIGSYVWGNQAVWNTPVYVIMILQVLLSMIIFLSTVIIQLRKKDFI